MKKKMKLKTNWKKNDKLKKKTKTLDLLYDPLGQLDFWLWPLKKKK